jgi:hypothetical protein
MNPPVSPAASPSESPQDGQRVAGAGASLVTFRLRRSPGPVKLDQAQPRDEAGVSGWAGLWAINTTWSGKPLNPVSRGGRYR